MEVFETPLPGIGIRYEFQTAADDSMCVVARRDGRRELVVYDQDDPDRARATVTLTGEESAALVELLGGSRITERLADLRHEVEGLSIEWVTMIDGQGLTGRTIGDGQVRTRTGASVVAVIRGHQSIPGPGPDHTFQPGDVALVMGSAPGVEAAVRVLAG